MLFFDILNLKKHFEVLTLPFKKHHAFKIPSYRACKNTNYEEKRIHKNCLGAKLYSFQISNMLDFQRLVIF